MNIKNVITQEEMNNLNIDEKINISRDIKNSIILIKNELIALDYQVNKNPEKHLLKIRKKLSKILVDVINIRKINR